MENNVSIVNIIVQDRSSVTQVNETVSSFSDYIIGRMGLPYAKKDINIISILMDAPAEAVEELSGKLGAIKGVIAKTLITNI